MYTLQIKIKTKNNFLCDAKHFTREKKTNRRNREELIDSNNIILNVCCLGQCCHVSQDN